MVGPRSATELWNEPIIGWLIEMGRATAWSVEPVTVLTGSWIDEGLAWAPKYPDGTYVVREDRCLKTEEEVLAYLWPKEQARLGRLKKLRAVE
jgi:hypothetical protein